MLWGIYHHNVHNRSKSQPGKSSPCGAVEPRPLGDLNSILVGNTYGVVAEDRVAPYLVDVGKFLVLNKTPLTFLMLSLAFRISSSGSVFRDLYVS